MRPTSWRRAAAVLPVAALGLVTLPWSSTAGAADPPELNVGDVTIVEGDSGLHNAMKFAITLSDPAATDTIVQWTITPGTATAGSDYLALKKPKQTKIKAGKTTAFATVKVLPDTVSETDETFSVTLDSVVSGPAVLGTHSVGTGTILDDEGASTEVISVGDAATVETNADKTKLALPFTLSSPLPTSEVHVTWILEAGTATGDTDYKPLKKPKTTKIKAGKTNAKATITVYGEGEFEPNETLTVTITHVDVFGAPVPVDILRGAGTGTIINDDPSPIPPDAPSNLTASEQPGNIVLVDWDAALTGGPPDEFHVEMTDDGGTSWAPLSTTGPSVTQLLTDSLPPGTYQFRVAAENAAGTSPYGGPSNEVTIVLPLAPGAPSNVVASLQGSAVLIDWDAPTTGDAPTSYNIQVSSDDGATWFDLDSSPASPTEYTTSLGGGTYRFRVNAQNDGGAGDWSEPSNELIVAGDDS